MLRLAIALLAMLAATPAYAVNELQGQPLSKIEEMGRSHGVIIEKLSAADTAMVDAASPGRPQPSTIYLLTLGSSAMLALVRDGVVIFSSDPVPLEEVNKVLKRSGA
ncbi:hypothetical protein GWE18_00455 [Bradyrhizobium sp. CSA112]|uniref:hypothetical protein n=1 Tax=Bradyrhizobium sp. CSA112 TaxID=2699170 RepID=UPI0023B16084|nr:hypothetical protein [Bradyrhizobium sp. CSA112]MDE5451347.1 hypothetical protein [Bradyrhizobium sp. CSA112]